MRLAIPALSAALFSDISPGRSGRGRSGPHVCSGASSTTQIILDYIRELAPRPGILVNKRKLYEKARVGIPKETVDRILTYLASRGGNHRPGERNREGEVNGPE